MVHIRIIAYKKKENNMNTFIVLLRNGEKVKIKADSRVRGSFFKKEESKNIMIAEFSPNEIVGVIEEEYFVE
jgi:hypothetical protein